MKILVDENIPKMTVRVLRQRGCEVIDIRGSREEGMADDLLWERAQSSKSLLITTDKGFAHRQSLSGHYGVLIVRLKKPNRHKIHERVMLAIDEFAHSDWPNQVVIMQDYVQRVWQSKRTEPPPRAA